MLPKGEGLSASGWGVLCVKKRSEFGLKFANILTCLHRLQWETVEFLYSFAENQCGSEVYPMTMPKREVNSVWSRVREDVDLDDLIFEHDLGRDENGNLCSDR